METLIDLVHGLPPELFNNIQDLVFTCNEEEIKINEEYMPPSQLRVSSSTRQQYANRFYGGGTRFVFEDPWALAKFFHSLPENHIGLIRPIQLPVALETGIVDPCDQRRFKKLVSRRDPKQALKRQENHLLGHFLRALKDDGILIRASAVHFTYNAVIERDYETCLRAWAGLMNEWEIMIRHYRDDVKETLAASNISVGPHKEVADVTPSGKPGCVQRLCTANDILQQCRDE